MSDSTVRTVRPPEADMPPPSEFGVFGGTAAQPRPPRRSSGLRQRRRARAEPFDVCHVGVVLRAVCLVHAALAIAILFQVSSASAWVQAFAVASVAALPATLLWLIVLCAARAWLAAAPRPAQWLAAVFLGALAGVAGWLQLWWSGLAFPVYAPGGAGWHAWGTLWFPYAVAGAGAAAAMFAWLVARARAQLPADQTARLAELQSRIRPHFLFNTLNTAIALARIDPARTEHLLEDLAELFRVALGDEGAAVSLADEVELARRYLAIEQIRFGDRLRVTWELDDAAAEARVPPLLLQPLVENAVRHGVEPSAEGGALRIRTEARLGQAVIDIANTVPADGSNRPGHGLALDNVRERLKLMHDVSSQFHVRREGGVHRVRIVVPL